MQSGKEMLRKRLMDIVRDWQRKDRSLPSHNELVTIGKELQGWKAQANISGLWGADRPEMITATIDDGMGQGLRIINLYAEVAGLSVVPLGLLLPAETIIEACRENHPAILGLTVLQFDSEETLTEICCKIPEDVKVVAGGPVFTADPEFARRCGVHVVAKNVAYFLDYLITIFYSGGSESAF